MLAYRVREHNKIDQRPQHRQKINTTNEVVAFKSRRTRSNVFQLLFSSPLQRVVPYILVPDQRSIFQDRIKNILHEFHVYLCLQTKPGCPSKGRCDYQIIGVLNALLCVVARIELATGCCCCCRSIRSAPRRERG